MQRFMHCPVFLRSEGPDRMPRRRRSWRHNSGKRIGGSGRLRRGELCLQQTREESENIRCKTGTIMILAANSLHAFYNKSSELCRLLGISTQLHQTFFDAVASADQEEPFQVARSLKRWNALLKSACNTICTSLRTM
jgi:hypothetical protein